MTAPTTEAQDPLDELARENEVIEKLDERLGEFALALGTGTDISAGEVAEGLRLFEQYLHAHARRFDESLQPEARPVAMSTCFDHLDAISRDRAGISERVARARQALDAYAREGSEGRSRLVKELETFTQHEYEELRYENDYPLSCLRSTLPDDAAERVRADFGRTGNELGDLDRHAERFLNHEPGKASATFSVRCHHPGCLEKAEAQSFPAESGHLGIRGPNGWRVVSHPPHASPQKGGLISVDIDFWCPSHAAVPESIAPGMAEMGVARRPPTSIDSVPHGPDLGSSRNPSATYPA